MLKGLSKSTMYWVGAGIIIVGVLLALVKLGSATSSNPTQNPQPLIEAEYEIQIEANEWVKGPETASLTIVEYGDFQCPACKYYQPFVAQLLVDFPNDIRLVFRHFPLVQAHPNAFPGARAAEAAGAQGKFWEMHDLLYEKQQEWANERNAEELFTTYARELALDTEKFKTDMANQEINSKINGQIESGRNLNVQGTPTFFINGQKIANPRDYEQFKALVQGFIDQANSQQDTSQTTVSTPLE